MYMNMYTRIINAQQRGTIMEGLRECLKIFFDDNR